MTDTDCTSILSDSDTQSGNMGFGLASEFDDMNEKMFMQNILCRLLVWHPLFEENLPSPSET